MGGCCSLYLCNRVDQLQSAGETCRQRIAGGSASLSGKETYKKNRQKGRTSSHRIASMALANLNRNKGKTALVVLSVSIAIILLNSVMNISQCFDEETYVRRDAIADFNVSSSAWSKSAANSEKVVPAKFVADIKEKEGVKRFGFRLLPPG